MATIGRFGPPLALMALIFYLSAQPDLGTGLGVWDLILRKLAHMTEYALLWFLWWRALGYGDRATFAAAAIAFLYAVSDELHQSFVETRHGTPVDVAIDTAGIALAVLLSRRWNGPRRSAPGRFGRRPIVDGRPADSPSRQGRRPPE